MRVSRRWIGVVLGAALATAASVVLAEPPEAADESPPAVFAWNLSASTGAHFSRGDYQQSSATDILYVPAIVRAELEALAVELTVPYIRIHGPAGIFAVVAGDSSDRGARSEDGLGDVQLSAAYSFAPWRDWLPFCELKGRVKFPTADDRRGLGTGEYDYGVEGTATWTMGEIVPFVSVGYDFLGDTIVAPTADGTSTTGFELNDALRTGGGASYRFTTAVSGGVQLDYRAPTSAGSGMALDVVPFVSWRPLPHWNIDAYATAGLASGSADAGGGLQFGYAWQEQ